MLVCVAVLARKTMRAQRKVNMVVDAMVAEMQR